MIWISELGAARLAVLPRPLGGDLLESEVRRFREAGVEVVVSALTSEEIEDFDLTKEPDYCSKNGITYESFPIPDHDIPSSYENVRTLVEALSKDLVAGKKVAIHCHGGVGRSALLAACTLCVMGMPVDRAFELIGRARGLRVPATELQRVWVDQFAQRFQAMGRIKLLIVVHHFFELWNAPSWFAERLGAEFPQVQVTHLPDYSRMDAEISDTEVVIAWSIRPEQVKAAKKLRWIHSPAAAVHQLMFPELINSEIILTNAREVHGPVVAEHVIALVFALAKKIPGSVRLQQEHVWGQQLLWDELPRVREVAGETLGLIGLGAIGRPLVRSAKALGMHVIAVREHPEKGSDGADAVFGPGNVDELFRQADYIVLAAPVTDGTKAIANAERFALMKSGACLINVGRGPLLDEAALAEALRAKKIGGAALDVFPKEPLAADSPLWDVPNLLITPHTAALTDKLWERHYALFSGNLRRFLSGQALLGVVDKRKGY